MGWTGTTRYNGESAKEFFGREFDSHNETGTWKVIDVASTLTTAYIALELTRPDKGSFVFALVCLTRWDHTSQYNFVYKEIEEFDGPFDTDCPRRILDLLTPLEEIESRGLASATGLERAREWRQKCEEHLASRSKLKLRRGLVIRTKTKVPFVNGQEFDTFIIVDARRLRADAVWSHPRLAGEEARVGVRFRNRKPLLDAEVVGEAWPRMAPSH